MRHSMDGFILDIVELDQGFVEINSTAKHIEIFKQNLSEQAG